MSAGQNGPVGSGAAGQGKGGPEAVDSRPDRPPDGSSPSPRGTEEPRRDPRGPAGLRRGPAGAVPIPASERRRALGRLGERIAAQRLEARGLRLVERNYRCPYGELDLIGYDERASTLVVVEVRTRLGGAATAPEASIGPRKQAKLCALAEYYRAERFPEEEHLRIDVCAISFGRDGVLRRVQWFENAVALS